MNRVTLIGNLGADPDVKTLQNGKNLATFSLATSERWKTKDGEVRDKTDWHRVVVFNPNLVKLVEKYTSKGSKIALVGKLQERSWEAQDGTPRAVQEVVLDFGGEIELLDKKGDSPVEPQADDPPSGGGDMPVDDIPFDKEWRL